MAKHNYLTSPPNLAGMPPGVPYIIGNEAAERFSYYGMKSVLTVFMAHYILNQSGLLAPMSLNEAYMYTHYFVFGVSFLHFFVPGSSAIRSMDRDGRLESLESRC